MIDGGSKTANSARKNTKRKQGARVVAQKPAAATPDAEGILPAAQAHSASRIDSFDDIIAHLLQLEPRDVAELSQVCAALDRFASATSYAAATKALLARAAGLIRNILSGGTSNPSADLDQTSQWVEQARRNETSPAARAAYSAGSTRPAPEQAKPAPPATTPAKEAADVREPDFLAPDADRDLICEFIAEAQEYIERAEAALLSMEADPNDMEAVNSVFRAFHTIKGTSGFMGLKRVTELAHCAESLLSRVRAKEITCSGIYADLTLRSIDVLKELMQSVQGTLAGKPMIRPEGYDALMKDLANPEAAEALAPSMPTPRLGDLLVAAGKATRETVEAAEMLRGADPLGVAMVKAGMVSSTDVAQALRAQKRIATADAGSDTSLRVRTDRLDRLIDMVGELVIAQSMVMQDGTIHQIGNHELLKKVTHAGKIVRELQDLTMSMRMVPLKNAFQKMARVARDLAHKNNRIVNFIAEGEDTEIDRNMVDVISDPLVHMVRNAIDHGLEPPDVRTAAGKRAAGMLRLSAYHSGGDVVVEIQDDGKGLDRNKIVEKAIAQGLIEADRSLSDTQVYDLIFAPGFSTADKITDISGRGVGMDVVKRSVEALRGRIESASKFGHGTTFTIRLPLTLAITDGMLVKVGSERYIIPTVNIKLSFRPAEASLFTVAGRGEMVMLREDLMPLFRLHRLFRIAEAVEKPTQGLLVVLGDGNQRCALLVDELLGQQQVVAKTLGDGLGKIQGVSGGAILGDGRVGLILDPSEIVALARQGGGITEDQSAA